MRLFDCIKTKRLLVQPHTIRIQCTPNKLTPPCKRLIHTTGTAKTYQALHSTRTGNTGNRAGSQTSLHLGNMRVSTTHILTWWYLTFAAPIAKHDARDKHNDQTDENDNEVHYYAHKPVSYRLDDACVPEDQLTFVLGETRLSAGSGLPLAQWAATHIGS